MWDILFAIFFFILTETKIILQIFSIYYNYIGKCCKTSCIFLLTNFCPFLTGYENVFEIFLGIYKEKISMEIWNWLVQYLFFVPTRYVSGSLEDSNAYQPDLCAQRYLKNGILFIIFMTNSNFTRCLIRLSIQGCLDDLDNASDRKIFHLIDWYKSLYIRITSTFCMKV